MAIWNFNVTHQDQTTTTGSKNITPPGNGQSANITNVPCLCGHNHTLVGAQANGQMSGSGIGSVAPPNDPGATHGGLKDDPVPSWDGGPASPEGDVDEDEAGDEDDEKDDQDDEYEETPSA